MSVRVCAAPMARAGTRGYMAPELALVRVQGLTHPKAVDIFRCPIPASVRRCISYVKNLSAYSVIYSCSDTALPCLFVRGTGTLPC